MILIAAGQGAQDRRARKAARRHFALHHELLDPAQFAVVQVERGHGIGEATAQRQSMHRRSPRTAHRASDRCRRGGNGGAGRPEFLHAGAVLARRLRLLEHGVTLPEDSPAGDVERRNAAAKRAAAQRGIRRPISLRSTRQPRTVDRCTASVSRRCAPEGAYRPASSISAFPSVRRAHKRRRCRRRRMRRSAP